MSESKERCIRDFRSRVIIPCIYESQVHSKKTDAMIARTFFNTLRNQIGEENMVYDHIDKMAHKLNPTLITRDDDSGKGIAIIDEKTSIVQNIMDVSHILDSIVTPINIDRIYVKKDFAQQATNIIKELQSMK